MDLGAMVMKEYTSITGNSPSGHLWEKSNPSAEKDCVLHSPTLLGLSSKDYAEWGEAPLLELWRVLSHTFLVLTS